MSAVNVFSDDMINLSKNNSVRFKNKNISSTIFDGISTVADLEKVGIKIGHGYMTSSALEYANTSKTLGKGDIGFTLKTKFMDSNTFLDSVNELINIDEKGYKKWQII